jgi:SOS-response transcriptional repressor LexA
MTPRQKQVLNALRDLTVDGVPPSMRQIAQHVGLKSPSTVHKVIETLEADGLVSRANRWGFKRPNRSTNSIGAFDQRALDQLCHADLIALKATVDARLGVSA